ncbi:MAG TPA: diguanylate cyclase, partial [Burkholderiales bacterium]|nr:diguanylate cyclase [Burkholderiales bacterium]
MQPRPDFPHPTVLPGPVRILLLEDDRISVEIVTAYLRRIAPPGSTVHATGTLSDALALLARAEVDLVVSDLHLPDSAGATTIESLLRVVGCPVIAMTSDVDPGLRDATLACGAYDFLHKGDLNEPTLARLVRLAAVQARTFRALRESEGRLRAIMNHEPQCVKLLDGEGRLLEMNPAGLRMIEAESVDAVRGQCVYGLVAAEHRAAFRDLTQRVARGEEGTLQFEIVGLKGARRWLETRAVPLRDEFSAEQLVLGITRDVTQHRQAEIALRESEARFRALTELSSDWYWEQDAEMRFVRTAGASDARGGITPEAHVGLRRWELPRTEIVGQSWDEHLRALEARRPFYDLLLRRGAEDGKVSYVSVAGRPMFDGSGAFTGYHGVAKDVTSRIASELALRLEHESARTLAAASSAAEGVRTVLKAICANEGWKCGRFFRVDEAAGLLRFDEAASYHDAGFEALTARSRGLTFGRGEGLVGTVWQSGKALWVSDTWRDARVQQVLAHEPELRSTFVFPVLAQGAVTGVVTMWNDRIGEPDLRLQDSIELIGSLLGQFLRRKDAEAALAVHLRYQERIARFGQTALAQRDRSELVEKATQAVLEALDAEVVAYLEIEPGAGELFVRSVVGVAQDATHAGALHCAVGTPMRDVLLSGTRVLADGDRLPFAWSQTLRSMALIPVRGGEGVRGMLCAGYRQVNAFAAEQLSFIEAAASVLSTGLLRIQSESRVAYLAQFDALTGLPNRTLFADRFTQMIMQAKRREAPLAVLFIDLDGFKAVNDTLGHAGGDALLKEVALRLQSTVRAGDTVARISGDEFAIVLGDLARLDDAALVAQKIIDGLAATVQIGGKEVFVTASVGIAAFPGDGADAETLLGAADAAMYRAKQSGRNAFQFFTAEINQRSRARAQMGADLWRALERE